MPVPTFTHPSFAIHLSVTRFCLPLSRFASLPSNKGKKLFTGALLLDKDHTKLLIVQRAKDESAYPDHWEIPGGKSEYGVDQTLLECVVREVKEETGLVVTAIRGEFDGFEWEDADGHGPAKQYNFIVEAKGEVKLHDQEHQAFKWVSSEEDLIDLQMTENQTRVIKSGLSYLQVGPTLSGEVSRR
ncbi:hypothetical protein IAU60_003769 [Kwoniella sp. DSM 27419]